jgi:primosomal protein N' (replication factor Y)
MPRYLELIFNLPLQQAFTYRADEKGEGCVGKRAAAPFGRRELTGFIIGETEKPPEGIDEVQVKPVRRVVDKEPLFGQNEIELSEWIANYYLCSQGEALSAMLPSGRRGASYSGFSADELDRASSQPLSLSSEQEAALKAITGGQDLFYLFGITGSGKTEVFLRAAEHYLQAGRSVIYLVPEIALTVQTAFTIKLRFGALSATFHSGMTGSERLSEWMRIKRGEARIVVGPRSAVFAPAQNLGLVIIDEEHDGSFKSGSTPRYHARQAAMRRAARCGAALVMGSATPSAEAWKLMSQGRIKRLNLTRRLSGGAPPEIKIVSLAHSGGCLTEELKTAIRETALAGRQTILFLNRRGFAYFYHCKECGVELLCKHCSVSLTWHKARGRAVCHYCGYETIPPGACPSCGSVEAGFTGFGTEMIEEEVKRTFPDLRVRRLDTDSVQKKGALEEALSSFRSGGFDILLGTQMVAKGLNFPGVRLVGVVFADTGLHLPDFRAGERTFSLIVQVAGRAGRFFPDGKVLVQTLRPRDPIIQHACALNIEAFFEAELKQREDQRFPPFTRLIHIVARSRDPGRADNAIHRLSGLAEKLLPPGADILGPAECPLSIIACNHRRHIILRGTDMALLHRAARRALSSYEEVKDARVYLEVDVDPVSLQ